jgi:hypothetical protein
VKDIPIYVKNVPNDVFNSYVFKYENRQKSKKEPYEHQQRQSPEVGEGKNLKLVYRCVRKDQLKRLARGYTRRIRVKI